MDIPWSFSDVGVALEVGVAGKRALGATAGAAPGDIIRICFYSKWLFQCRIHNLSS